MILLLQRSAGLVEKQIPPDLEQPGHLDVRVELIRRFQLPRAAGDPEEAVQSRSSVRSELHVLEIARYHVGCVTRWIFCLWLPKHRAGRKTPGKCFFSERGS